LTIFPTWPWLAIIAPQLTASALSTFMIGRLTHAGLWDDILIVLHFSLITFPLTLAVALIVSFALQKTLKFWDNIIIIIVAGIAANLLSKIIPSIHHTDNMGQYFVESARDVKGPPLFILFAYRLVNIWWRDFGPIMFIQALIVGTIFGYKLTTQKTKKNEKNK
jgi:hypothetical protein